MLNMRQSFVTCLGAFLILCGILLPCSDILRAEEKKESHFYEIQEGDTLWDISMQELGDPFRWPNIWDKNPSIKDPDKIYPNQKLIIPDNFVQKVIYLPRSHEAIESTTAKSSEKKDIESVNLQKVIEKTILLKGGFIKQEVHPSAVIAGSPSERNIFGRNDYIYLKLNSDLYNKFYIVNADNILKHPITGENLGRHVRFQGIAQIVGDEVGLKKALILNSYREITDEDILVPYFEIEPPLGVLSVKPTVNGMILETSRLTVLNGEYDIVFLDKGTADGIVPGDVFNIYRSKSPKIPLGQFKVIAAQKGVSTGYVTESFQEIGRGDTF